MASPETTLRATQKSAACRLVVIGGHTRSIGKTQLVCDIISALPQANWLAGKITQYGHGVCATNGHDCDCAPTEHIVALDWEVNSSIGTDSARFLQAGAARSFWLRTKQGYLAEGMPPFREALAETVQNFTEKNDRADQHARNFAEHQSGLNVIVESNSLMQFVKPSLYVAVLDTARDDFKDSARHMLDRADVLVFRRGLEEQDIGQPPWMQVPTQLLRQKPSLLQREGEPLPDPLFQVIKRILELPPTVFV